MKPSQITAFLGGLTCLAVAALAETTPAPGTITRGPSSPVPPAAQTGPGAVSSSVTLRSTTATPTAAAQPSAASTANTTNTTNAMNAANAANAANTTITPPGTTQTTTTKTTTSTNSTNPAGTVTNADGTVTNADGTVTKPGAQSTNSVSAEAVAADASRFKGLDTDGDNRISRTEFTLGAAGPLQGDTNVAATATVDNGTGVNNQVNTVEMFTQLDTNKDGFLSASELAAQHQMPMRTP